MASVRRLLVAWVLLCVIGTSTCFGAPPRAGTEFRQTSTTVRRGTASLGDRITILAPATPRYNCIAHTLGMHDRWVWPGLSLSDFDRLYGGFGYRRMRHASLQAQRNVEKIVLYAKVSSSLEATHAALQSPDGTWTSKLGQGPLVRHQTPGLLSGSAYGKPVAVYWRTREGTQQRPGLAKADYRSPFKQAVVLAWSEEWYDTGMDVSTGNTIVVHAKGNATYGFEGEPINATPETNPDGNRRVGNFILPKKLDSEAVKPDAPIGALLGSIKAKDGRLSSPFLIGSNFKARINVPGRLVLLFNDVTGRYNNNTGSYTAYLALD